MFVGMFLPPQCLASDCEALAASYKFHSVVCQLQRNYRKGRREREGERGAREGERGKEKREIERESERGRRERERERERDKRGREREREGRKRGDCVNLFADVEMTVFCEQQRQQIDGFIFQPSLCE